jgi:glycosyltransferase involved in cell wall biosynthesis
LKELKEILIGNENMISGISNVIFTGAVQRESLPRFYNVADYFVFPSITDTFGMVILEAQACGLPVIVSNQGGPKEIIEPSVTGFIVEDQKKESWIKILEHGIDLYRNHPKTYQEMRRASRELAMQNGNWDAVLKDLLGDNLI